MGELDREHWPRKIYIDARAKRPTTTTTSARHKDQKAQKGEPEPEHGSIKNFLMQIKEFFDACKDRLIKKEFF